MVDPVVKRVFDLTVADLAVHLRSIDFRQSRLLFRKKLDGRVLAISIQGSSGNSRRTTYLTFYTRVALIVPLLARVNYPQLRPSRYSDADGLVRLSVGDPERGAGDWHVDAGTCPRYLAERIGREIQPAMQTCVDVPEDPVLLLMLLDGSLNPGGRIQAAKMAYALAVSLEDPSRAAAAKSMLHAESAANGVHLDIESEIAALHVIAGGSACAWAGK